jgi:hypothetical protein
MPYYLTWERLNGKQGSGVCSTKNIEHLIEKLASYGYIVQTYFPCDNTQCPGRDVIRIEPETGNIIENFRREEG